MADDTRERAEALVKQISANMGGPWADALAEAITAALQSARNAALTEAEHLARTHAVHGNPATGEQIAVAIRALKDTGT